MASAEITIRGTTENSESNRGTAVNGVLWMIQSGRPNRSPNMESTIVTLNRDQATAAACRGITAAHTTTTPITSNTEGQNATASQNSRPTCAGSPIAAPKLAPTATPLSARSTRDATAGTTMRDAAQRTREIADDH